MARGTPLAQLRYMLGAELNDSLFVTNTQDVAVKNQLLANMQQWLSTEYDWPNLEERNDVNFVNAQRYGLLPAINYERPVKAEVKWNQKWQDVLVGIGSAEYNAFDSDIGNASDPIMRWRIADQVEIAPPTTAPTLTASGVGLTGTYQYTVTFVNNFGETSIGKSASIVLANQGTALTAIPVGPLATIPDGPNTSKVQVVSSRNVYRTAANGSVFKFLTTLADNSTTTYNDTTVDASLGAAPPTYSTAEATAFEVWPLPVSKNTIRFTGQRILSPLVNDTDTADLDDQMIVLFTAAEILARSRQKGDAQLKLAKAQARLDKVRANYPRRMQSVVFGQRQEYKSLRRIVPMIVVAGSQSTATGTVLGSESGNVLGPG